MNDPVSEDRTISGPHGDIPVRRYVPETQRGAGLVWLHGGAFISGDLEMPESDWVARRLAQEGITVVTVDYRLAPTPDWMAAYISASPAGRRFPVASEEITEAFRWASRSVPSIPSSRWTLGGASAGANLAASGAYRLRDSAGPRPAGLVLAYPLVHKQLPTMRDELAAKYAELPEQERFSPETVIQLNGNYVDDPADLDNPYAFPGGHDPSGLPPTLVLNSDLDSLRASGQAFAAELALAGVPVSVSYEPGTRHGHLNEPESPGAERSIRRIADWLTRTLFL